MCIQGVKCVPQSNPDVVQQSIGNFVGNRTDPFQWIGDEVDCYSDSSSSEDDAFLPTREDSTLDIRTIQTKRRPQSRTGLKSETRQDDRVKLVQTPDGLRMSKHSLGAKTELSTHSKYVPAKVSLKDRFNQTTNWQQNKSAPTTPTTTNKFANKKLSYETYSTQTLPRRSQRSSTPLGAVSSKMRSSFTKLNAAGSITDLRDILRPQSSMERSKGVKRSSSGGGWEQEQQQQQQQQHRLAKEALDECIHEVDEFKQQVETFLGKRIELEQDLTRLVEDRSLHSQGVIKYKGVKDTVHSILQNLYRGLVAVAEPDFIREEAARVLSKFQFTLYQIPYSPNSPDRPASSLMLQSLRGRALDWDYLDPPSDCSTHYYLQLQIGETGRCVVDIMTVQQCEEYFEKILRGKESKFSIQIERGVAKWQMDLEKRLGRRVGMFVDTIELLRDVPDQSIRCKVVEGIGSNFCRDSLGRLVDIIEKISENNLTRIQIRKKLRYIELGPLSLESPADKVVEWRDGGLVVRARWQNGVTIDYKDIFECFKSEN